MATCVARRAAPAARRTAAALPRPLHACASARIQPRLKSRIQLATDRPRLPGPDLLAVDLNDRRDIGGRSRHEQLVQLEKLRLGERPLPDRNSLLPRDLDDHLTRDARQDVRTEIVRE